MPLSFHEFREACRCAEPRVAVVLGSGFGELAESLAGSFRMSFSEVPELDAPTVAGHPGSLHVGTWGGQAVLLFAGRLHHYEGQPWRRVEQTVATAHSLGATILLLTNASGGIRDDLWPGSLLAVRAHIEWTRAYAWRQLEPESGPYSTRLVEVLQSAAAKQKIPLPTGTYAQVTGPCYETPAEIQALRAVRRRCGGHVHGPRDHARGHELGMECAAISCITNRAAGLGTGPIHHGEVLATAQARREQMGRLIEGFLREL